MVRWLDYSNKMLNWKVESPKKRNCFIKEQISVNLGTKKMFEILFKRNVVELFRYQVVLSGDNTLALRIRCANQENSDRNHPMNGLYIEEFCDTLK